MADISDGEGWRIVDEEARRIAEDEAKRQAENESHNQGAQSSEGVKGDVGDVSNVVNIVADSADAASGCLSEASFDIGSPDCFLATATLSDGHHDLDSLRNFRDRVLIRSVAGRIFVRIYYSLGGVAAGMIRGRSLPCFIVREGLVRPVARLARRVTGV